MRFLPGNAQHPGARESQQDAFAFSDPEHGAFVEHGGFLAVVADGMGGLAHGAAASTAAVRAFLDAYAAKACDEAVNAALVRSLLAANEAVLARGAAIGSEEEMGTTLAAAVMHGGSLHWISSGDSRIYLCRAGELAQVSTDHVYAADLDVRVARGDLARDAALADPDRDALTSYLGTSEVKHLDRSVRPFPLLPGDRLLLCSDGLYRALSPADIAAEASGPDPQRACEALVELVTAKRLPQQDNVTVLLIACEEAADSRAPNPPDGEPAQPSPRRSLGGGTAAAVGLLAGAAVFWWWPGAKPVGTARATPTPASSPRAPLPTAAAPIADTTRVPTPAVSPTVVTTPTAAATPAPRESPAKPAESRAATAPAQRGPAATPGN